MPTFPPNQSYGRKWNGSSLTVMRMPRDQNGGRIRNRVFHERERLALEQAKRVPWKQLAQAVDQYTDWQVFALWLRVVVETAGEIPALAVQELNARVPQFLSSLQPISSAAEYSTSGAGLVIWQDLNLFVETEKFIGAKRDGWLDAVRHFSSMSLRSMQAWSHWEAVDLSWRAAPPQEYPDYPQWECQVAAVDRLSNPESVAQKVLGAVRRLPGPEWRTLLSIFSELMAFSIWLELIIDVDGPRSGLASKELGVKYRAFRAPRRAGSRAVIRALKKWAIAHLMGIADEDTLAALSFQVCNHPAYPAMLQYASYCHRAWSEGPPNHLPTFEEWREGADQFVER
jgi:hypothetical protein